MEKIFRPSPKSFKNTFCVFQEVSLEAIQGLKVQYDSKSGSNYFYTKEGMFRLSNHWGRLANSKWRLEPIEPETESKTKLGFAPWTNFYPDNAEEELYYLEANYIKNTVNYQHKNNPSLRQESHTSERVLKRLNESSKFEIYSI